jgi:CRP/FNR family transcriptional regulator, cyclic AMP receptor protein
MIEDYFQNATAMSITVEDRADMLDKTRWLQDMDWKELLQLAGYVKVYRVPAETNLFGEGGLEPYMGIIVQGVIQIFKRGNGGEVKSICKLQKGMTFGEMSLIDGMPRSASVKTIQDSVLIIINNDDFHRLVDVYPKLFSTLILKISRLMSANIRRTSALLVDALDTDI